VLNKLAFVCRLLVSEEESALKLLDFGDLNLFFEKKTPNQRTIIRSEIAGFW